MPGRSSASSKRSQAEGASAGKGSVQRIKIHGKALEGNLEGESKTWPRTAAGVAHIYETYGGTHNSRRAERIETEMLPFFSKNLTFTTVKH